MTGLKASIQALRGTRNSTLRLPQITRTASLAEVFDVSVLGSEAPKPSKDYNLVAENILNKVIATGEMTRREALDAAWCLWETKPSLASNSSTLTSLVKATEDSNRKQPFRALASSYMTSYAPDRRAIEIISRVLMRLAGGMGKPWAHLQQDLNLFHPIEGPKNLAREAVERGLSPTQVLHDYGLGALNAQSGFAKYCIAEALEQMRDGREPRHGSV